MEKKVAQNKGWLIVSPWELERVGGVTMVIKSLFFALKSYTSYMPMLMINRWEVDYKTSSDAEYKTVRMRLRPLNKQILYKLKFYVFLIPHLIYLHKLIKEKNIGNINIHYPSETCILFSYYWRLFKHKIGLIYSFHGTDIEEIIQKKNCSREQWIRTFNCANKLTFVSHTLLNRFEDVFPEVKTEKAVLYNGIEPSKLTASTDTDLGIEAPYLLNVGSFLPVKNQSLLIKAYSQLDSNLITNFKLAFAGKSGAELSKLKTLVTELGIQDRVIFFEEAPHKLVCQLMKGASLFVLSSVREGFPLVLLEAGYFGLPIVSTDVGGISELIDNSTGYLCPSNNANQLSKQINEALMDRESSDNKAKKLQMQIKEKFTWEKIATCLAQWASIND